MAKKRTREDYVVFPVSLLALWWNEQCFDFRVVLAGIVKHANSTSQIVNHKEDWNYLKSVVKRIESKVDNKVQSNLLAKQPLTSLAVTTLNNYVSEIECNGSDVKEDLVLLAYLAIKSMLGESMYNHFTWDAILSRMIGNRGGRFSRLPKEKQDELVWANYCLGKRGREMLIKGLKKWGVAYVPVGRGFKAPAFSFKLTESNLIRALENDGKSTIDMKEVKHRNQTPF